MLKYIKIFKGTPTCFDLNRSTSGSSPVPPLKLPNNLKLFKSLKPLFSNFNKVQAYSLMMIC